MKRMVIIIICFSFFSNIIFPDEVGYQGTVKISIESENYIINHFHDWEKRFAYLECIDKNNNEIIFNISCPALTSLYISDDEKYIAGISYVKLGNPYHLIILTITGEYIKKRHINILESKLNLDEYFYFINNFHEQYLYLLSLDRIYSFEKYFFINYIGLPIGREAASYLAGNISPNHLSDSISESVSNFINWFNRDNVDFQFIYENDTLFGISLLDRGNRRIIIPVNEL